MANRTARLDALLGGDLATREVYRVRRGLVAVADLPKPGGALLRPVAATCWRCGAMCSPHGGGVWRVLTLLSRLRGSHARGVHVHYVHVGCVPTDLGAPLGLPARKVGRR
ncbi:MAG TPA: hypothetical protein VKQ32_09645 [Polyangia bacterium]|nr:hypothetical protein [Polyangia bacterium]